MPVQASCEHCGFSYVAKDDMAGKRVRCRNCGQIFTISLASSSQSVSGANAPPTTASDQAAASPFQSDLKLPSLEDLPDVPSAPSPYERNSDITRVMPAIETTESNMTGGIGSAKSMMQRTGDPGTFDVAEGAPAAVVRPFKPFDFPFAPELDRFAPKIVLWLMLIWVAYVAFAWNPADSAAIPEPYLPMVNDTYPAWAGLIPAAVMLVIFAILWLPLFALALHKLSTVLRFQTPTDNKSRAAALAVFPFALGSVLWLTGWSIGSLVSGVVLGIIIGTPAAWFLYRLREKEIPYAAIFLSVSSVVATTLSIALYTGANQVLSHTLSASGKGNLFDVSPMGPHLNWPQPQNGRLATSKTPAGGTGTTPTRESPAGGNAGGTAAVVEVAPQGLLRDRKEFKFDRDPLRILLVPGRDDVVGVGVQAKDSTDQEVIRYKIDDKSTSPMRDVPALAPGDACMSPDANRMALLVRSMGNIPVVKVWSFVTNKLEMSYSPPEWQATDAIQILGFLSDSQIVCTRRQRGAFQPLTLDLRTGAAQPWYVAPAGALEDKTRDVHSQMMASSTDLKSIAVTAFSQDGKGWLRIYHSDGTVADCDLRIRDRAVALNPTGLSFSPDGTKVAASFERPGAMSILTCPATSNDTATPAFDGTASFTLGIKPPERDPMNPRDTNPRDRDMASRDTAPPPQNQLVWLAGGDRWLYGRMIIDGPTQQKQGTIDLGPQVLQMTITDGEKLCALVTTERGNVLVRATIATSATPAGTIDATTSRP